MINVEPMDIACTMTDRPLFTNENENCNDPCEIENLKTQSKVSECIRKLYPADSELRKIAEDISKEIILENLYVRWDYVVGLQECKSAAKKAIVYPLKCPILFASQFSSWKGILLYGPPGTGKTMLAKAIATDCNCTFFNITASSLVSKWRGDSDKCIRVLFDLAYNLSPSIIFIDGIDWITTNNEKMSLSEPAKRFRAELLSRLDELLTSMKKSNVVLLAATNAPWDIDAALLRRLKKRIYVPLPDKDTRRAMFNLYLSKEMQEKKKELENIIVSTEKYTYADIKSICMQAWMEESIPIWTKLERKEISMGELTCKLNHFNILQDIIASTRPVAVDMTKYTTFMQSITMSEPPTEPKLQLQPKSPFYGNAFGK